MRNSLAARFTRRALALAFVASPSFGEAQPGAGSARAREANRLDVEGKTAEARVLFKQIADAAPDPAAKAAAHRAMAISYGFDGDCANAAKYESLVIDYWKTREQAEPQNAFYQQGEMANEAARLCIDAATDAKGLAEAERLYRLGRELGLKEPAPKTHPAALWEYRTEHALARLAARRGQRDVALRHVAAARQALDADREMAKAQERFFPYLTGYVHLFTNDLAAAEADLTRALAIQGNATDPFMTYLLAMTYEKKGDVPRSRELYQKAYDLSTGHNPPSAFARPNARKKLSGQ